MNNEKDEIYKILVVVSYGTVIYTIFLYSIYYAFIFENGQKFRCIF